MDDGWKSRRRSTAIKSGLNGAWVRVGAADAPHSSSVESDDRTMKPYLSNALRPIRLAAWHFDSDFSQIDEVQLDAPAHQPADQPYIVVDQRQSVHKIPSAFDQAAWNDSGASLPMADSATR